MGKYYTKFKKLACPYYPDDNDNMDTGYIVESIGEKRVAEYLRISMLEVEELDLIEYLYFKRETFIYNCSQTDEGREYLRNAKRLEQTTPDRKKLREKLKKRAD